MISRLANGRVGSRFLTRGIDDSGNVANSVESETILIENEESDFIFYEVPGKGIFEIRNQNFFYIQVIVFGLGYFPVAAVGTYHVRYHQKIVKIIFLYFLIFFKIFSW